MKTCMYSTSLLEGSDALGSPRLERTERYLRYYYGVKAEMDVETIWLCDNASDWGLLKRLHGANIYRFDQRLRRDGEIYPDVWRGLYFAVELMRMGYEKIIYCETDAFILSSRLTEFIYRLDSGFTALWCPRHDFPAAEITVLCSDYFSRFRAFCDAVPWGLRRGKYETVVPFTRIEKDFVGDRYGETEGAQQEPGMDYFCQARLGTELRFR